MDAKTHEKPLEVKELPLADLIPYARNARTHTDAQIAQIAASLREFGWTNPVLVDSQGGIIAGHGRVLAARQLGFETVPTITLHNLTEAQRRAYVIVDNKLALNAGWDAELLKAELADLQAQDFDLALTGFSEDEINQYLGAIGTTDFPDLPDGEKGDLEQITFTLHQSQAETVRRAVAVAEQMGAYGDTGNDNRNGNAIARVAEMFIAAHGEPDE